MFESQMFTATGERKPVFIGKEHVCEAADILGIRSSQVERIFTFFVSPKQTGDNAVRNSKLLAMRNAAKLHIIDREAAGLEQNDTTYVNETAGLCIQGISMHKFAMMIEETHLQGQSTVARDIVALNYFFQAELTGDQFLTGFYTAGTISV